MVLHGISNQKYEETMGTEGLILVASECTKIYTLFVIAVTVCTLFYSDFKISCILFCHADFKQSHSVIFNLFFAYIIYMHYVGKVIFLLCADYRKYTRRSSLWGWVGVLCLGVVGG